MDTTKDRKNGRGVSIIACTNDLAFIGNLFTNYTRQKGVRKELIVVINKDSIPMAPYLKKAQRLQNVKVYRIPGRVSLGKCLNFGVSKANYSLVAKFDHDDYYAPNYLNRAIRAMKRKNADVVGKRTIFTYLQSKKLLVLRFPGNQNRFVGHVAGGTILFKKKLFRRVRFSNISLGEDVRFLRDCRTRGFKIYSSDKYDYVYIRRKDPQSHTWKIGDTYLIKTGKIVKRTENFKALTVSAPYAPANLRGK